MAYQPKSYRKFVATAATATLVAGAIAPLASAASFTDVAPKYKDAVDFVVSKGVKGLTDTQFGVSENIKRVDAAVMLVKVLGLDTEKAPASGFTDVPARAAKEVNALKAAGITSGKTATQFGANDLITRGELAVWIQKGFELKGTSEVTFTDVPQQYKAAVSALVDNKVTSGINETQFGTNNNAKRGDFAIFLMKANDAVASVTVEEIKVVDSTTLTLKLKGEVKEVKATDFKFDNGLEVKEAKVVEAPKAAEDTFTYVQLKTSEQKAATKYTLTELFGTKVDADKAPSFVTPAVVAPAVESVSAINATQVVVKYTVEVDKTEAETVANYKINSNSPTTAKLGADKKTVTLTFANASEVQVTNGVLSVEPIATAADKTKKTAKFAQVFSYKDEVAPTISSVEAKTNSTVAKSLTVKTSEPIQSGLAKVNDQYVTVNFNGTDTAEITGLALETGKNHTLELINLTDKAGNKTVSTSATFTVSVDSVAPTATVTAKSDKAILVTFSKPMDVTSVTTALVNGTVKDEALASVATGTPTVVADTNDTQFIIPISEASLYANKDSRTFHVVLANTITDKLGNKVSATTQAVTLTKDTVKPVATGYNVIKNNNGEVTSIEVNFSEGLAAGAPAVPSIVNENGVAVTNFLGGLTAQPVKAGDKKVVYTATTPAKLAGTFAFSFAKDLVTDQAETANKSDAFNYTINFGTGETTFELVSASAANNVIQVNFGKAVKGGAVANSATDLNNYSLAGKPLPAGTTIVLDGTQKVATITLPTEESVDKTDTTAIFTAANVQAISGETLKAYKGTVSVTDNVKPVLKSAKVLDNKTIELTYSEAMSLTAALAEVGDEFIVKEGTTALTLADNELKADYVSGFDNKIKITINKSTGGSSAVPGTAVASGTNASVVSFTNQAAATATETVAYKVVDVAGTLKVQKVSDSSDAATLDATGNGSFTLNGVTVTIAGAVATNEFTVATTAAVPSNPGTATTLDLTKAITVETKATTTAKADVKDKAGIAQKVEVKVDVAK